MFVYLADARVPSERAHVLQIFKSCEALARHGVKVELVHPCRRRTRAMEAVADAFEYYQVKHRFSLREIRMPDWLSHAPARLRSVTFLAQSSLFACLALRYASRPEVTVVYTRDLSVASVLSASRRPFFLELHTVPDRPGVRALVAWLARRATGVVVISQHLADDCAAMGVSSEAICVAPDAVDAALLETEYNRDAARRRLGLPIGSRLAMYVGHLYPWKGIEAAVGAAQRLADWVFVFVGGMEDDLRRWRRRVDSEGPANVDFVGHVPPSEVASYLAAADVLLLPNSAKAQISRRHTSPLKLFEYMASGRPIVASDLPSLREILVHEENALLVTPDDSGDLAAAIRLLQVNPALAARIGEKARRRVSRETWDQRAEKLLDFLRSRGAALSCTRAAAQGS